MPSVTYMPCTCSLVHYYPSVCSMTPKMLRMQVGVLNLFGFEVRPLAQEGAYEYRHAATGLRFQVSHVVVHEKKESRRHLAALS